MPCTVSKNSQSHQGLNTVIPHLQIQLFAVFFLLLFFWDVSCLDLACSSSYGCQRSAPAGKPCFGEEAMGWRWKVGAEPPALTPLPWHGGAQWVHQGHSKARFACGEQGLAWGATVRCRAAARCVGPLSTRRAAGHDGAVVLQASLKLTSLQASHYKLSNPRVFFS